MFFNVADGGPFGEFCRIIFVGVLDDGVEDVQGNGGFVRGVFQAAGGSGLCAHCRALVLDGGFKGGDVCAETGEKIGGQAEADELGGERRRVGLKSAGGVEQGLVATAAGQAEFSIESCRAEERERMRGFADAVQVVMEMKASGDLGKDDAVRLVGAGNLCGPEAGGLGNGGVDEGELLSADARNGKIRCVLCAESRDILEGCGKTGYLMVHNDDALSVWLVHNYYPKVRTVCNSFYNGKYAQKPRRSALGRTDGYSPARTGS